MDAELSEDLSQFREFWQRSGGRILEEEIERNVLYNMSQEERGRSSQAILTEALDIIFQRWLSSNPRQAPASSSLSSSSQDRVPVPTPFEEESSVAEDDNVQQAPEQGRPTQPEPAGLLGISPIRDRYPAVTVYNQTPLSPPVPSDQLHPQAASEMFLADLDLFGPFMDDPAPWHPPPLSFPEPVRSTDTQAPPRSATLDLE
jgi:hypothetical protein